jgi:hypothetical protein
MIQLYSFDARTVQLNSSTRDRMKGNPYKVSFRCSLVALSL